MRANNVLGIIHSQAYDATIRELTAKRTIASVPVAARYRLIDFPLSNMVNAGVTQVGIFTTNNYQSLMDHLGSGKPWDLARKNGGLFLLPPYSDSEVGTSATTTSRLVSLVNNLHFLERAPQEYVVMTDANAVYNIDFSDLFDKHEESGADITICYKHGVMPNLVRNLTFKVEADGTLSDLALAINGGNGKEATYSFNIYVMKKTLLIGLLQSAASHNAEYFTKDVLLANASELKFNGYEVTGFAAIVDSMQSYYNVSMALLEKENRKSLFDPDRVIATKVADNVPATYGAEGVVKNSLIADGCVIDGDVEDSILFRGVIVEKGATVKNCILMQGTVVHAGAQLNSVITDKNVNTNMNRTLISDPSYPIYIPKNMIV